ncbi:MAG: AAA family ATPase, partial [Brevundimonas sp.]|nr:AAA family ATPase [Brevundimonas sp.]
MSAISAICVPEPLRAVSGWLIWRFEHFVGEAKPRKIPFWADGTRRHGTQGGPQDRDRLTTFVAARDAAVRMGFDGVGFAPLAGFGYTFLDFDNCVDAHGNIPPEVEQIVSRTYAEYSPSGKGIRAVLRGDLGNHKSYATPDQFGAETFSSSGFVTFTGNILPSCELLGYEDRIAEVDDNTRALCERRFGTSAGATFDPDDFMAGREPKLGLSIGEMEALLQHLDPSMGREPWLRIGMALKHETDGGEDGFELWDEWSSGGDTYPGTEGLRYQWESFRAAPGKRLVTMATVIKMANEAKQRAGKPFSANELMTPAAAGSVENGEGRSPPHFTGRFPIYRADDPILQRPVEWLIKGVLPRGDLGILYGQSGSGKTFVALDMAMALVRGVPWRGHRVPKPVRVLYVAAEGSGGVGNRIAAYLKAHGIPHPDNLGVMPGTPSLLEKEDIKEVLASVRAADGFDVVIIDTFAQVTPGANENAAEDMGRALSNLRALAGATQAMPILVHHAGKDASKGARGWSGLKAAADVQIEVIRRDNGIREIHVEKLKDGEDGARFGFELEVVDLGVDEDGDPVSSCVIRHTDATPIQSRGSQVGPRGGNQQKVFDCAKEAGAELPQGALMEEVIDLAIRSIPYDPASSGEGKPKRDQRRGH